VGGAPKKTQEKDFLITLLVEQLPVQLVTWQALPAALAEDSKYRFGVLHYAYLTVP
jgi:hypothetical protein